ncbi:MAG: adenylate/guanylate cyclase domain-containing protein [Acidimicrobiia bacterium]|nr:adenylate/guanylate cyclase domain-containing protein [Acidimicrobiia bacterium]
MTRSEMWRTVWRIVALTVPWGAFAGLGIGLAIGDGGVRSILAGGLIGLLISIGMVTFDASWGVGLIPRGWRESPFLVVLVSRSLVWLLVIVIGIVVPLTLVADVPVDDLTGSTVVWSVVVSFFVALLINFLAQINRLLGRGVLVRLILGRYHRPREEVRAFLLVDLRESTQIAERLGNLRYHSFLKRFIGDVTGAALRHGAEIYRYVGDEVILTWDERRAVRNADCLRTVFAMEKALDAGRDEYATEFGVVPTFWAGLHMGPVVTGEIGGVKHEIAYLGDTLNAAARIEQACRDFGRAFLASADVVNALDVPTGITVESLGPIELRGVGSNVELMAVTAAD